MLGLQQPHTMYAIVNAIVNAIRQAKLLVSRRHAFFTKICVSPAGRVCVYSSLILSTFFPLFFSSSIAVFFIAKPSSIVVFVVQTKWTFNHEGRGHRSPIGVSRGIGRPHRDTLGYSEYKSRTHDAEINLCDIKLFVIYHIEQNGIQTQAYRRLGCRPDWTNDPWLHETPEVGDHVLCRDVHLQKELHLRREKA